MAYVVSPLRSPEGLDWPGFQPEPMVHVPRVPDEGAHMRYCPECGAPTTCWGREEPMHCRSCGWDEDYDTYYSLLRDLRRSRMARSRLVLPVLQVAR